MKNQRLACILFPEFPLELACKIRPDLRSSPLALTDQPGETALLTSVNDRAAAFGVTTGMTVAQANSLCPDLVIGVRDHERERTVLQRLEHTLKQIGPDIETDHNGAIFLESSRLCRLYPEEPALARAILTTLHPFGYPVKIGFAANKFVARTAARHADPNR